MCLAFGPSQRSRHPVDVACLFPHPPSDCLSSSHHVLLCSVTGSFLTLGLHSLFLFTVNLCRHEEFQVDSQNISESELCVMPLQKPYQTGFENGSAADFACSRNSQSTRLLLHGRGQRPQESQTSVWNGETSGQVISLLLASASHLNKGVTVWD